MKTDKKSILVDTLGQVGYRFQLNEFVIYIDPYLSHSVQEHEGADLVRLRPIPISPESITDANLVLITHAHRDHCDEATLGPIYHASTNVHFIGPPPVAEKLLKLNIPTNKITSIVEGEKFRCKEDQVKITSIPAAHPTIERDRNGFYCCVGYVIEYQGKTIYHAGDTSVSEVIIDALKEYKGVDIAFLPVNERNYFKDRRGIIGNMSVREAFQFAVEIGAKTVVPTHWDMFEANQVFKEEISIVYDKLVLPFKLDFEVDAI